MEGKKIANAVQDISSSLRRDCPPEKVRSLSIRPRRTLLAALVLAHLVSHVYAAMHLAIIPVLMTEFDLDIFAAGIIVAIPLACQFLMTIPSGILADRVGGYRLIVLSLSVTVTGAALANQASSTYMVMLALSLLALAITLYHPPAYSMASQLFPSERRSTALGIHGAGGTLGIALGPISMGILLPSLGWRFVYLAWMLPAIGGALLCWKLKLAVTPKIEEEQVKNPTGKLGMISVVSAGFLALLSANASESIGRQLVSTFLSSYLVLEMKMPVPVASMILGLISLMGIIAAPVGGIMADKLGEKRWVTMSYVGMVLSILGIASVRSIEILVVFVAAYGYFAFSAMGARASLVTRFTPLSRRGIAYSLFFLPIYGAGSIAPVIGASVAKDFQIWSNFPLAAAMICIACVALQLMPIKKSQMRTRSVALVD